MIADTLTPSQRVTSTLGTTLGAAINEPPGISDAAGAARADAVVRPWREAFGTTPITAKQALDAPHVRAALAMVLGSDDPSPTAVTRWLGRRECGPFGYIDYIGREEDEDDGRYVVRRARHGPPPRQGPARRPHRRTRPGGAATAPATLLTGVPITLDSLLIEDLLTCIRADDCVSQGRRDELCRRVEAMRRPRTPRRPKRPVVSWLSPRPGLNLIGDKRIESPLVGLSAAWVAICSPGERVSAADFTLDAVHPGESIRGALRRGAALLDALSKPAALAVRRIRVVDDCLVYTPGDVDIRTS